MAEPPAWSTGFLSALVHELRTPVASLLLTSDLLASDPRLDPRHARYARSLEGAAADLQALLDEVGELNRLHSGRVVARLAPVAIEELLERAFEPIREDAAAGPVLETAVEPGGPAALATDAALLGRALEALVRSAAAAGARRVELRVTGGPLEGNPAGRVVFLVADDGEAVPPSDLPRLLVPFAVSSARTRRPHGGSGLGLALAAALVRALGGELEAAGPANGDRGLTLRLSLPP